MLLDVATKTIGAAEERYWFVPCLSSWRLLRGKNEVLWFNSHEWRRLTCDVRHMRVYEFLGSLNSLYHRVKTNTFWVVLI